jgi:hypothetical protein
MALMSDTNEDAPLRYILQLEQRLQTLANDLGEVRGAYIRETNNRYHRLAGEQLIQQLFNMCIGIAKHRCKQLSYPAPENPARHSNDSQKRIQTQPIQLTGNKSLG